MTNSLCVCCISESEIEEQVRQLQAEEAAMQMGITNQYAVYVPIDDVTMVMRVLVASPNITISCLYIPVLL